MGYERNEGERIITMYNIITVSPLSAEDEKRFVKMGKKCPQCKQGSKKGEEGLITYPLGSATCIRCYACGYFTMNHDLEVGKKKGK